MSEYGSGLTIGMEAELDKERIKHALNGELVVDQNEEGFVFAAAPSADECHKDIIYRFEKYVHLAQEGMAAARAYENILKRRGVKVESMKFAIKEFMPEYECEIRKFQDFVSDFELEELEDEIKEIEHGEH